MSTEYYALKYPITGLRIAEGADFNILTVWVQDGLADVLNLPRTVTGAFLLMLADNEDVGAMATWWAGKEGTAITDYAQLPNDALVISARGELLTAGQVRALAGRGRKE